MKNIFSLDNKVALITGSSSGMGKAIAEAMGEQGGTVIISSNDEPGCKKVVEEFSGKGIDAFYIVCDVSKKDDIVSMINAAVEKTGRIDILVSCTGIAIPGSSAEINGADFEKTMAVNLQSAIYLSKLVIPQMATRNDGVIIFLASIAGLRGNKSIGLYGLSKAALLQLARNLAVEWGPQNIRVNCISPGMIDTNFAKLMTLKKDVMERRLSLTPLRRIGQPAEVAGVAVMLASGAGTFITGQNIIVDGGTIISDGN